MVHSYSHAEKIWHSLTVIINPQTENRAEWPLEWIKWVVDIEPGRDGLENLRILKRWVVEVRPLKHTVFFFFFRIWSKQISLGLDRQRWVEILNTTRCTVLDSGGVNMVEFGSLSSCRQELKVERNRLVHTACICVMFWPVDPAKNAIQGNAPEGGDTFWWQLWEEIAWAEIGWWNGTR